MHFLIVGLNHKTSPLNVREQFSFHGDTLDKSLGTLLSQKNIKEAVIFSNQDMVEIYTIATNGEAALSSIKELLGNYHDSSFGKLDDIIYSYSDLDAIRHLFYVAYGFESMLIYDPNILHQLTDAFTYSMNHNSNEGVINKIIENARAIAESKEIRRIKTQYLSSGSTISFAATELTKKLFDNITAINLLLIGGGEISEEAARSLINSGVKDFVVISNSFEAARKKAEGLYGKARTFDNLLDELSRADVIICSTGEPNHHISREQISHVMELRLQKPLLILDISVPRNIEPDINEIDNVYLYDFDNMAIFSNECIDVHQKGIDQIKAIIEKEAKLFWIEEISNGMTKQL